MSSAARSRLSRALTGAVALLVLLVGAGPVAADPDEVSAPAAQQLTAAYDRAVLLGRVFASDELAAVAAAAVTARIDPSADAEADIAGPPQLGAPEAGAPQARAGNRADATGGPADDSRTGTRGSGETAGPDGGASGSPHAGMLRPGRPAAPSEPSAAAGFEVVGQTGGVDEDGYSPRGSAPGGTAPGGATATSGGGWVCPVPSWTWFTHDWGFPRSGGRSHQGNDIFAPKGSPLLAVADGVVTKVRPIDRGTLGGITVSYLTDDGLIIYNAHLDTLADGMTPGVRVRAGQQVGTIGNSGNARTTPPHLHIGVYPASGGVSDPYRWTSVACRR